MAPCAEEGDLRLINEEKAANWVTGNVEVFFEGSWSKVCAADFGAADAVVACRQLGYGAGTIDGVAGSPMHELTDTIATMMNHTRGTASEAAISLSGCTGEEKALLDCPAAHGGARSVRGCPSAGWEAMRLACVAEEETGTYLL